jgi:hypothetical protein
MILVRLIAFVLALYFLVFFFSALTGIDLPQMLGGQPTTFR